MIMNIAFFNYEIQERLYLFSTQPPSIPKSDPYTRTHYVSLSLNLLLHVMFHILPPPHSP